MTLEEFKKQHIISDSGVMKQFMNMSVVSYMDYIIKLSDGSFKPNIDRLMRYSDYDDVYWFDFGRPHTSVRPDIRVCELLYVAEGILNQYRSTDTVNVKEMKEGIYIINCLLNFPFTVLREHCKTNDKEQRDDPQKRS